MHNQGKSAIAVQMNSLSRGKKMVLWVFIIWAAQAIPKWTLAITADGETSAKIISFFITPRAEQTIVYNEPEALAAKPLNS